MYKNIKNNIEEVKKDIGKVHNKRGLVFSIILSFVIGTVIGFWVHSQFFGSPLIKININSKATVVEPTDVDGEKTESRESQPCTEVKFEDNLDDWIIEHYDKPDESGFYCPRGYSFKSPDIWHEKLIPILFNLIEIKYRSKNKNDKIDNPAAFIFSIGEDPRILRFYITETNPQVIGFEKISIKDPTKELEREDGKELEDPIQYGTEVILRIESVKGAGNEVIFHFNLKYISAVTEGPMDNSFSYSVILPSPDSEKSEVKVSFGTLKGDCIKPVSYKICY